MSFKRQLDIAIKEVKEETLKQYRLALNETFLSVIVNTPVDKGQAINSWFTNLQGVNKGDVRNELSTNGSDSIRNMQSQIDNAPLVGKVLLYSNLPYMERLENGWSLKSDSMVKNAVANWPVVWRKYSGS